jgi:peptidoglycan/xylan/chitin deacetylase (PgdA/CDA1 family)
LAYHNVVPTGEHGAGEVSLHVAQRDFARQLDLIASSHRVVSLESVLEEGGESDPPRVAITFDDAYLGAMTAGLDELRQRSMPATVFVAPGLLGGDTWWDRVAEASRGVMPSDIRRHAIENLCGDHGRVSEWFATRGGKVSPRGALPRIANETELASASQQPGISFAAHSWSHGNLSALSSVQLENELAPTLDWLSARFPNTIPWLSYPYGLTSPTVERAAERAKFRGAFLVSGGWMSRCPARLHALPRLAIPAGMSPDGLSLRLSGIASNR